MISITSSSPMSLGLQLSAPFTNFKSRNSVKIRCKKLAGAIELKSPKPKTLPPGPWKIPLVGNLHNLIGSLPHHALRELAKEYGPIMHLQLGEICAIVVSNPRMAQEVLKTHDHALAQRPDLLAPQIVSYNQTDIAFSKGEYWKQMRKLCVTELLSHRRVQQFSSIREEEVSNLVQSIKDCGESPFDLSKKVFTLTNIVTSRAALGDKCRYQDVIISLLKQAISLTGGFDLYDLFPSMEFIHTFSRIRTRLEKIHNEVDEVMGKIIHEHKENIKGSTIGDNEDLLGVLMKLQGSGSLECPITSNNIKAVIWDIFAAGTDTSSTTVEWAISEMLKSPRVLTKAQAEVREVLKGKDTITDEDVQNLPYLKLVIKETLRLHPPAPLLLPRESQQTCEINGYEIPNKSKIIINAFAIQRDPEYWPDPDRFIPERFENMDIDNVGANFEYIPFGAGRRICPGVFFGLANVDLPLASLLYHFDWKLPFGADGESLDMTETFGATVGRKNPLVLIATPNSN